MTRRTFFFGATAAAAAWALAPLPAPAASPRPPRSVSLKPNITEVLFALGAGERIVGVTRYCPPPAKGRPPAVVADYRRPDLERVVALSPDLILASRENGDRRAIERLQRLGLRVALFDFSTIAATQDSIRAIGAAIGAAEAGERLAARLEQELEAVARAAAAAPRTRALGVWGRQPLVVGGRGTYFDELLMIAGGINAVAPGAISYPHWDLEQLIGAQPAVLFDLTGAAADAAPWSGERAIPAVRDGRVIPLDPDLFRPGPRMAEAARLLRDKLR